MNSDLSKLHIWLNINKLSLNIDKTHYIIFTSTKNRVQSPNLVKINNISIKRVNNTKFLGVILDSELKWKLLLSKLKFLNALEFSLRQKNF